MVRRNPHSSLWRRTVTGLGLAAVAFALAASPAPAQDDDIYRQFDRVSELRSNAQYAEAVELLDEIIRQYAHSVEYLKRAYNEKVFTLLQMRDEAAAERTAREALERFPDLTAETSNFPPEMNDRYEALRAQMYSGLTVNKPVEARLLLDGDYKGDTPLHVPLVRVGLHELTLMKPGYLDHTEQIEITAGQVKELDIAMEKPRGKMWWLTRVGAGVVATGVVTYLLASSGGEGGGGEQLQPLSEPPPPPGQ